MDKKTEKGLRDRAYRLGEMGDTGAVPELLRLLQSPSVQVRRLSASALGKLAGLAPVEEVVPALNKRLRDPHRQVRQYVVKALSAYGEAAKPALSDLRDMAANPHEKDYNQRDAAKAVEIIEAAVEVALEQSEPRCQKCERTVSSDEYARSMRAFQRVYCDKCFNQVYLQQGKKLVSLHRQDKPRLREILQRKLSRYIRLDDNEA